MKKSRYQSTRVKGRTTARARAGARIGARTLAKARAAAQPTEANPCRSDCSQALVAPSLGRLGQLPSEVGVVRLRPQRGAEAGLKELSKTYACKPL